MIDLYKNIDSLLIDDYNVYLQSINGMVYKTIQNKDIFLNQYDLSAFYMWQTSGSSKSEATINSYQQFKYTISSSVDFIQLEYDNINKGNQKLYFHSASLGYALDYSTLRYDTTHERVLYYYGYANRFGYGTPFNTSSDSIPSESLAISPSMIAYYSIKNVLSNPLYVKDNRIQIKDQYFIDEFVFIKIPRYHYHEELLKGTFNVTFKSGSTVLSITDISDVNVQRNEDPIVYLKSGSSSEIYGILDTKNALAIIDTNKLKDKFGENVFTVDTSISNESPIYVSAIYDELSLERFTIPVETSFTLESYDVSYYYNLHSLTNLLYSGSQEEQMHCIGLETEIYDEYYIKIGPGEFNVSTNPTYLNGWNINKEFVKNPISYITTIGLYNDNNDCLAIAKLSKPLKKMYNDAFLIKIRLKQ